MGHIRLGVLPRSRKWRDVVAELEAGGAVEDVARKAAKAAEVHLKAAGSDPLLLESLRLLALVPLAARGPDFAGDLARLGIEGAEDGSLIGIGAAMAAAVDRVARREGRTDLGEMAQMAAVEALTEVAGQDLPSLFDPSPAEVRRALGRLASGDRFARLARTFFATLTRRVLQYYLSRELGNHVGAGQRFADDRARARFDAALDQHCWEAARIVEAYAGGWYGKAVWQKGQLGPAEIGSFAPYALKKMRAELGKRRDEAA